MKKTFFVALIAMLMFPIISNSYALQEVAGQVNLSLKPGDSTSFNWGILSDSGDNITVTLRATGDGSQFLSYPSQVALPPQKIVYVTVNASIPSDYYGKSTLTPFMIATQAGQQGGPTILNIQVQKLVTMNITGAPTTAPTVANAQSNSSGTTVANAQSNSSGATVANAQSNSSGATVPEFPSATFMIFGISIMLVLGVMVLSKQQFGLYKI